MTVLEDESAPAMINNRSWRPGCRSCSLRSWARIMWSETPPIMASEDRNLQPGREDSRRDLLAALMIRRRWRKASKPVWVCFLAAFSPFFAPPPELALRTGVTAMTDAALELLQ